MKTELTLDDMLQEVSVEDPCFRDESGDISTWFGVSDERGIIAYFGSETDALRFRLDLINRRLNPTHNYETEK